MINEAKIAQKKTSVFHKFEKQIIYPFLLSEFGELTSSYFIYHNIDQYVDIYTYLVNGKHVINFDVSTIDQSITINSIISVDEYKKEIQGKGRAKKESREYLDKIMKEINSK
ncbi:hypothetical protein A9G41_06270 [Gilliamella sp. Nev5-1]|uniref:hypothetical protein n=1 Tax=unclassified Gilliamella TaxID=2685620 RepID=UPI00080DF47D|nr:hypothetical protein [Gilliamella apicola]OCG61437.1 hypothetical protein A9G40_00070 [Gilliamella apicola]OCG69488.1 hypothetical protein A9G41_06270 [Gilliamella apicola]